MQARYLLGFCAVAALGAVVLSGTTAQALTMKECSAKYKEAQTANTLNGQKWNDFRKAQCGTDATAAAAPAAGTATDTTKPPKAKKESKKDAKAAAKEAEAANPDKPAAGAKTAAAPAATGPAVFPTAVSTKYSSESAGKARMHTCLDQYKANKETGGNGGLVWIKKGGGYYSECNKRLNS